MLPKLVKALLQPEAYLQSSGKIELAQTQMSFIFLTDDYVYKVKKPVNLGYLDYTTLEKRRFYCQREVVLNCRFCTDVYLGVVPITKDGRDFAVGGDGEIVEYVVKMKRLPQDRMLDCLLSANKVTPEMMTAVAKRLAEFHQVAKVSRIGVFSTLYTVMQNTEENFTQTEKYVGKAVSLEMYRHIQDYARGFIMQNTPLFVRRTREGRIRDCHGDLHTAHICFADSGIQIFDCIEFNDRFRYCDVASEVAFLAMDLDYYGRADLSRVFVDAYVSISQDKELPKLLNFYKCYRAYVRGKVNSFRLDDTNIPQEEKDEALERAKGYFELADGYTN